MSRWLVSNVPSWLLLLGLIVVVAGGAVLIQLFVRRRFPGLRRDEHNDAMRFAFGVVGFVFAFFVGFVVSAMWGQINSADGKSRIEGAAGVQLARDLTFFDKADSDRIRQSLLEYEPAAVAEWPVAASGGSFPEADSALQRLYTAYTQVRPRTDAQTKLLATSFSNLDKMSQARTERVLQARTDVGPPWSLWAVIFLTSGLLLGLRDRIRRGETRHALHDGRDPGDAGRRRIVSRRGTFAPVHRRNCDIPRTATRGNPRAVASRGIVARLGPVGAAVAGAIAGRRLGYRLGCGGAVRRTRAERFAALFDEPAR